MAFFYYYYCWTLKFTFKKCLTCLLEKLFQSRELLNKIGNFSGNSFTKYEKSFFYFNNFVFFIIMDEVSIHFIKDKYVNSKIKGM